MRHIYAAFVFVIGVTAIAQDAAPSKQQPQAEDATALEARYKTCAKHYIPTEKCTPEIYQQLKEKDEAPPDSKTAAALGAVKEYRIRLKNPDSMQVHTAYVTNDGAVCLEIGGQNGMGGPSVSRVVYLSDAWPHRGKGKWMDEGGILGGMAANNSGTYQVDRWGGFCYKVKAFGKPGDLFPGTDVTEKVTQALKDGK
jgi:hypothetical protein